MNLKEFIKKFKEISEQGWIETKRKGDTGVGHTLESLLGLEENNISTPDIEGHELKAKRNRKSPSRQTLFTYEGDWCMSNTSFLNKYGYLHSNLLETSGNMTVSCKPNVHDVYLNTDCKKSLKLKGLNEETIISWEWEKLVERFIRKFPKAIQVTADTKKINGVEHFHYTTAMLFSGGSKKAFKKYASNGCIISELRLRTDGYYSPRNRGTAFRIAQSKFDYLFDSVQTIH
jgi:hypothetical protein